MKVTIEQIVGWDIAKECALATIGKTPKDPMATDKWKAQMLLAGHSPIRAVQYLVTIEDIGYCYAMHLVRHKHGVEWFVSTSREDRTKVKREERKQTDLISLTFIANAQAMINISKKRLCAKADIITRKIWSEVVNEMEKVDHVLADKMQPDCVWNGTCLELQPCGLHLTNLYNKQREMLLKTDY